MNVEIQVVVTESLWLECDCPKARPLTNKVTLDQKCDAVGECYCPTQNGKDTIYEEGSGCVFPGKLHFYWTYKTNCSRNLTVYTAVFHFSTLLLHCMLQADLN